MFENFHTSLIIASLELIGKFHHEDAHNVYYLLVLHNAATNFFFVSNSSTFFSNRSPNNLQIYESWKLYLVPIANFHFHIDRVFHLKYECNHIKCFRTLDCKIVYWIFITMWNIEKCFVVLYVLNFFFLSSILWLLLKSEIREFINILTVSRRDLQFEFF